jgi:hypothetical protein
MGGIFYRYDDSKEKRALIIPTVLRVTTEEIEYWSNMTCLYDKFWEFDPNISTLPISFFYITSLREVIKAQGAEKRVIVYESPTTDQSSYGFNPKIAFHPSYKNNLEVIMDNVVVQPKQYQMEIIIPDSLIGPYHRQGLQRLQALVYYIDKVVMGHDTKLGDAVHATLGVSQTVFDVVETTSNLADIILGIMGSSAQFSTINKNSIEAMASKGHVLVFKKWTGYNYSYGIITDIEISKKPAEQGIHRGVITFQETPILNITNKKFQTTLSKFVTVIETSKAINLTLARPFMWLSGVETEAGSVGSISK